MYSVPPELDEEARSCASSGRETFKKLKGQERFFTHFFSCNAIGLMLNFYKVEGAAAPSAPAVPTPMHARLRRNSSTSRLRWCELVAPVCDEESLSVPCWDRGSLAVLG